MPSSENARYGLTKGQTAPPFFAQTLSGETVTLANYRGHALLFVFFQVTPGAIQPLSRCMAIAPKATAAEIVTILVSGQSSEKTRAFIEELQTNLPILISPRTGSSHSFFAEYHVSFCPAYCFIDEQGVVQAVGLFENVEQVWKAIVDSRTQYS